MPEHTPHDQPPSVKSTYDATAGMFASIDRAVRREETIRDALMEAYEAADSDDTIIVDLDGFLDSKTRELVDRLAAIDKG